MGWKLSLIIIENKANLSADNEILKAIKKSNYQFDGELTLDKCIHPNDNSINIGYYNGNVIISDDYQITINSLEKADNLDLTKEEIGLVELFPNSEIVSVAGHSTVNYHGYSVIKSGIKKRLKIISSERPKFELGDRIEEELKIYEGTYLKDNKSYWKDEFDSRQDNTEDQLMEEFTFGVAKRRLGVLLDQSNGAELMEKVTFKRYINPKQILNIEKSIRSKKKTKWTKYGIIILILIIWQILKRIALK